MKEEEEEEEGDDDDEDSLIDGELALIKTGMAIEIFKALIPNNTPIAAVRQAIVVLNRLLREYKVGK